jgi:hypothetical protein
MGFRNMQFLDDGGEESAVIANIKQLMVVDVKSKRK